MISVPLAPLTRAGFVAAVEAGVRAPSLYNSRPWRFRLGPGGMDVLADPARRLVVADPTGRGARRACGAAAYNATLALAAHGVPVEVHVRPDPTERDLLVRLVPGPPRSPTPETLALHAAIPRRRNHRGPFTPEPVPAPARAALVRAARDQGTWLELLVGSAPLAILREVVHAADAVLNREPSYRAEVDVWTLGCGSHRRTDRTRARHAGSAG